MQNLWVLATETNEDLIGPISGSLEEVTAYRNIFYNPEFVQVKPFTAPSISEMLSFEFEDENNFKMTVIEGVSASCRYHESMQGRIEMTIGEDVPTDIKEKDLLQINSFVNAVNKFTLENA